MVDQCEINSDKLTHYPTFHFLCRDPNDDEYFHHYIHRYARHDGSRWYLGVDFKATEEVFNTAEQVLQSVLTGVDVLGRLKIVHVKSAA